jgi:hypothetical protein
VVDERSRLHEIVDRLPEGELALARQLLELLARGRGARGAAAMNGHEDDEEPGPRAASPASSPEPSPETVSRLAQLTDDELLRLDELLEHDPDGARQFWRERFGEELPDADLGPDPDE